MSMKSLISETIEKGIKQIVCPIKLHESKVLTANFGHKCLPENVNKIPENADTRYAGGPSTGFYNSLAVLEATAS